LVRSSSTFGASDGNADRSTRVFHAPQDQAGWTELTDLPPVRTLEGEPGNEKLKWAEVGMATEPGRYQSRYGLIEVTVDDL
jgi:hypothetical protein